MENTTIITIVATVVFITAWIIDTSTRREMFLDMGPKKEVIEPFMASKLRTQTPMIRAYAE